MLRKIFITLMVMIMTNNANASNNSDNIIHMELKTGTVKIELFPEVAPKHVERFKELTQEGFYDGIVFHRVIDGFMVQGGDPEGTGMGGSDKPDLKAEFSDVKHVRGILSMARSQSPDSANSQFFIMLADSSHLDGQYSAFGKVIEGMDHIDQIKKGNQYNNGTVKDPDSIIKMTLVNQTEEASK